MKPTTRLTLITFLLFMSRGMILPLSSVFWRSLGASYLAIGLLSTVTSITTIIASPLWGKALDRTQQRRRFLMGGLVALSIATGLVAVAPTYIWLFPIYVFMTFGQVAFSTSSLALMGDWFEYEAADKPLLPGADSTSGRRMGTYRGLASLGFGLMAFTSGTIVENFTIRTPFILSALFLAVGFLLALGVREAPARQEQPVGEITDEKVSEKVQDAPAENALPPLPLSPLLVSSLLWSLAFGAVYAVWANFMVDEIGYTAAQTSRLWSLASLSEFPLMIVTGWLSDRTGRLPMLTMGFLAWTIVFTGYLVVPVMPWILGVQLLRGFAFSAHTATSMTYAAEVRKRAERGRISGYYSTAGALGSILGATLGGAVTEYLGFRILIGICAGLIFTGAVYLAVESVKRGKILRNLYSIKRQAPDVSSPA